MIATIQHPGYFPARRDARSGESCRETYDPQRPASVLELEGARIRLAARASLSNNQSAHGLAETPGAAITRPREVIAIRAEVATEDALLAALRAARPKDLATSATQVGPHRDDLAFELDGREVCAYASQAQLLG